MLALAAPLAVRPVGDADQDFLDALYRGRRDDLAALAHDPAFFALFIRQQQQAQRQGMQAAYPEAEHLIVERQGQAVGRIVFATGPAHVQLVDLALLPAERGNGTGSALLRALQAHAGERGLPLMLSVGHSNAGAARLYGRLGFSSIASDEIQLRMEWRMPSKWDR